MDLQVYITFVDVQFFPNKDDGCLGGGRMPIMDISLMLQMNIKNVLWCLNG